SGFAVWHGGLTGSAPTMVASSGHFAAHLVGVVPMAETTFSALNLVITGSLVVAIALLFRALVPASAADLVAPDPAALAPVPGRARPQSEGGEGGEGLIHRLQTSWLPGA